MGTIASEATNDSWVHTEEPKSVGLLTHVRRMLQLWIRYGIWG